ncbi:uncharacterized protein METZ01_LOCUS14088 [marine metagenome]|uniref:SurA N-terminal domain-containing protein n=1 Tax=marine metagenome TaxID=408172 RepID=A0A381P3V3_9ZZZZ|tara:strand:+ start:310 stop:909 length:600 start_codon:yes stop_codon:yes gene_type:complete
MLIFLVLTAGSVKQDIIDKVVATVDRQLIMLSDVRAVTELGVLAMGSNEGSESQVTSRLINSILILVEVDRFLVSEPPQPVIQRRIDELKEHHSTVKSFETAWKSVGMTEERLYRLVRNDLRIDIYLRQRFTSTAEPTNAELVQYHKENQHQYVHNGSRLSFNDARELVRDDLLEERRQVIIQNWIARLHESVEIVYVP